MGILRAVNQHFVTRSGLEHGTCCGTGRGAECLGKGNCVQGFWVYQKNLKGQRFAGFMKQRQEICICKAIYIYIHINSVHYVYTIVQHTI